MANTIKFKRASGSDPSASDLAIGEPGLRTDTAELFFKKDDGTVAKVSGGGGGPNFKYLELRNAANNGAASFPGNDFTLVTAGTTTAITPAAANTLIVSVSGVIQKPNSGTSTSGITGFIVDGSRFKTATNLPAAPDFIVYQESGGIGEPSDNTVTSAKIVDGAIVNADINASAAIAKTKIETFVNNNGTTRLITGTNNVNELDAESNLTVNGSTITFAESTLTVSKGTLATVSAKETAGNKEIALRANTTGGVLRTIGSYPLIFEIAQAEKMRLDTSGNLGIGTTSPVAPLHVAHSGTSTAVGTNFISLRSGASGRDIGIQFADGATSAYVGMLGGSIYFADSGSSEKMRIDSSGRVLQGKSATKGSTGEVVPTFCNEIASTNPNVFEIANNGTNAANSYSALVLSRSDSTSVNGHTAVDSGDQIGEVCFIGADGSDRFNTAAAIKTFANADFTANNCPAFLTFHTNGGSASASERMRIDSSGNVGIGTTPSYKLHVKGGAVDLTARFENTKTGNGDINYIGVGLNSGTTGVALFGHTGHSTAGSQAAWMGCAGDDVAGGVGVKTFRGGAVQMNGTLRVNTTTQYGRIHGKESGFNPNTSTWLTNAAFVASGSFGGGYCLLDGSKGYSMYCHGNGANFSIQHHSSTTATASGGVQLTNGATSWTGMSDERDKENLVTISDAITKIKTLRTVIGNYIWQPDVKHAFLIAQDVQAVLPEAVDIMNTYEETEKQRLGLRYTEVIPLLTAALQEAIGRIEALEAQLKY